jgi:uncharacterized protein (DUF305 family)
MKKLLSIAAIAILFACNNNNEDQANGIDSSHGSHHTQATSDTGSTMKQLMDQNMQQMMGVRSTGNADYDFAALMKIHHQGAVDMGNALLKSGKNEQLRAMAQQIITDQQKEIASFDSLLAKSNKNGNDTSFFNKSMQDMHHMQLTDEGGSIDRQFIQMMIPHHEGAIVMAKTYLQNGAKDATLKKIANNIIKSQETEIQVFKKMLPTVQ